MVLWTWKEKEHSVLPPKWVSGETEFVTLYHSRIWSLQSHAIMDVFPLKRDTLKLPLAVFEQGFLGVVVDMNNV